MESYPLPFCFSESYTNNMKEVWYSRISTVLLAGLFLLSLEFTIKRLMASIFRYDSFSVFNLLEIKYTSNSNMAFGIPMPRVIIISLTLCILMIVSYYFVQFYRDAKISNVWAANLIIWGAVSNFYDRFKYGHVIDYINFGNVTVFNLSDAFIVLGALILGWNLITERRHQSHQLPATA